MNGVWSPRIGRFGDALTTQVVDGSLLHELDLDGRHVATRSRLRGTLLHTFTYSLDGTLATVTDDHGQTLAIATGPTGATLTAPNGLATTLTFDGNGQLATVTSPEGAERIIEMAPSGLLTRFGKKGDPTLVGSHQFTYDGKGLLVSDRSPDGQGSAQTLESSTDIPRRVVTHTTAEGRMKRFEVDRNPAAVASTEPAPSERRTNQAVTGISGSNLVYLSHVQDDYAGVKRVSTAPDTSRSTVTFASDPKLGSEGQFASKTVTDTLSAGGAANRTTTTTHARTVAADESEQVDIRTVNGLPWETKFTRLAGTTETKSPLLRTTKTWLDATIDRVIKSQVGPDAGGDPVTLHPVEFTYEPGPGPQQGKVATVAVGGVGGRVVTYAYNAQGYVSMVTAPDGKVTTFTRDVLGRVTEMTLPGGRVVTQEYDVSGNVRSIAPRADATHELTYSASGQLLSSYLAPDVGAPRTTSYVYDRDKLLKEIVSPVPALKQTMTRDAAGRVTALNETSSGANRTRTFTFNAADAGHLSQQVASETVGGTTTTATQAFAYSGSRHTTDTQTLTGGAARTLTRDHDNFLRPTSLALGGVATNLTYSYDLDGLVTNVGGLVATRGSTVALVKSLERAGQDKETITYDSFGAPLTMLASHNGVAKGGLSLTFDAMSGRIVTKEESWTFGSLTAKTWTYDYDTAGRLAAASDGATTHTYTYDATGNRTGATVDAQDRVTSQTDDAMVTTTYAYDDHGNVSTRTRAGTAQTLAWDSQGSLLSVAQASNPVKYILDAQGRRVGRKTNGTLDREWLYDGQLRIVGEVVHSGTTRYRLYGYLPERHLPVTMTETVGGTTKTYRIYGDHLGSLRAVVESATGNVVQTMQHGPWGEILDNTVTGPFVRVPFGFAGGNYDENTGLVRFGAREYDSGTGRWLSKDEARFGGGWNFYEYAAGDPVDRVDLDGRFPKWIKDALDWLKDWIDENTWPGSGGGRTPNYPPSLPPPAPGTCGWQGDNWVCAAPDDAGAGAAPPAPAPPGEQWRPQTQSCQSFRQWTKGRNDCCERECGIEAECVPPPSALACMTACLSAPSVQIVPSKGPTYR